MAEPLVFATWSEAERAGLEAKTGAVTSAYEGPCHSGMEIAFSLAALELCSGPGLMSWTVHVQQIWWRNSGVGSQSQLEALKAGCGNCQGSGSCSLDHTAEAAQGASGSSEGWTVSFLVNLRRRFAPSSETCTP